ncbi:hypothetical protein HYU14_05715 [Candidatus Woesearchaeota archaeon]|nr:hypothetical protein [Candidatus Woesearchaeota archaeon]
MVAETNEGKEGNEAAEIIHEAESGPMKGLSESSESESSASESSESPVPKARSDFVFLLSIGVIVAMLTSLILFNIFFKETPKTIDELHEQNLLGELSKKESSTYNGFSFVFADGLWYTQVQNPAGTTVFDVPFHYKPQEVEDIPLEGFLNTTAFNNSEIVYVTFNPLGAELQYVALAVGEFDNTLIKAFNKMPVAACDRNETNACAARPIITCNATVLPVLYMRQSEKPGVIYQNNCILVYGSGEGIVKAMERLLYNLYGVMKAKG